MSRLIDADELIEHVWREDLDTREKIANLVERMPTASDWDRYSTKLWKEAYERGKKDATQPNTPNTLETLDCISRQAAIDALCSDCQGKCIPCNNYPCGEIVAIQNLPTAQPERMRGRWEITDAYPHNVYCSECHKRFAQTHWAVWEDGSLPRIFCPNCGADMRED